MKVPIFTGALGSTEIARANWEHFAVGAAISGITLVCGENVCGIDPGLKLDAKHKVKESPEMDRRINTYRKFHNKYGEILVQMNVEDTRLGVAEYVASKHNLDTIELKWGQGAKCIGGEIKVKTLERAIELEEARLHRPPGPDPQGEPGRVQGRRHQGIRAPLPPRLCHQGRFPRRDRPAPRHRFQACHLKDRCLLHGRTRHGPPVLFRSQDRPPDH